MFKKHYLLTFASLIFILSSSAGIYSQSKPKADDSYLYFAPKNDKEVENQIKKDYNVRWDRVFYVCVKNKYLLITPNKYDYFRYEWYELSVKLKEILLRKP